MYRLLSALVMLTALATIPIGHTAEGTTTGQYLTTDQRAVLEDMYHSHSNYWLSKEVMADFGLPNGAYKYKHRARFGYSNPTEWGYAWQAWLGAAERHLITQAAAVNMIERGLQTFENIQLDPTQSYQGHPFPYYRITQANGDDLDKPFFDGDQRVPSGDNALLYLSITVVEGWARLRGEEQLAELAARIRARMSWDMFLIRQENLFLIAHQYSPDTDTLSDAVWDVYCDEGGMVTWTAFLTDSVDLDGYLELTDSQSRHASQWTDSTGITHTVEEAAWFNMMFTWTIRSFSGFPIGSYDCPTGTRNTYSSKSLIPNWIARRAYAADHKIDHPAFSVVMTQTLHSTPIVGWAQNWYIPPTLPDKIGDTPRVAAPHSLFVPLNALPDLSPTQRQIVLDDIISLRDDTAGYYHNTGETPFGFEALCSAFKDVEFPGSDDGRQIFESLSGGYSTLSLFQGLQHDDGAPGFSDFALHVPGLHQKIRAALYRLYPRDLEIPDDLSVYKNTDLLISDIRLGTAKAALDTVQLHLSVTQGTLIYDNTTGLTVLQGDAHTGSTILHVAGTIADLSTALTGLHYTPNLDYTGADTLTLTITYPEYDNTGTQRTDKVILPITVLDLLHSIPSLNQQTGLFPFSLPITGTYQHRDELGIDATTPILGYDSAGYNSCTTLHPGKGYWTTTTQPLLTQLASPPETQAINLPLKKGWNLLGVPSTTALTWDIDTIFLQTPDQGQLSLRDAYAQGLVDDCAWIYDTTITDYRLVTDASLHTDTELRHSIAAGEAFWLQVHAGMCELHWTPALLDGLAYTTGKPQ